MSEEVIKELDNLINKWSNRIGSAGKPDYNKDLDYMCYDLLDFKTELEKYVIKKLMLNMKIIRGVNMKYIIKFIIILIIAIIAVILKNTILTNAEYEIGVVVGWLSLAVFYYEKIFK